MLNYTELFTWGGDQFGQLSSHQRTHSVPRFCTYNILISAVSCGDLHAGFISKAGHIYTMGSNADGRLGIGDASLHFSSSPCLVESLLSTKALSISCGGVHTAVVCDSGSLYTWGQGTHGSLGLGDLKSRAAPHRVPLEGVLSVSCGFRHTGALCVSGLKMWGDGESGQLGTGRAGVQASPVGVHLRNAKQVACGVAHTLFLVDRGGVYAAGDNSGGQLGTGNRKASLVPVRVEGVGKSIRRVACGSYSGCITHSGELYVWGTGVFGEATLPLKPSDISAVDLSIGNGFGAVIDSRQAVWTWGGNHCGELGLGDTSTRVVPTLLSKLRNKRMKMVSCGSNYVIALGKDVSNDCIIDIKAELKRSVPLTERSRSSTMNVSSSSKDCFAELKTYLRRLADSGEAIRCLSVITGKYEKLQGLYQQEKRRAKELSDVNRTLDENTGKENRAIEGAKQLSAQNQQLRAKVSKLQATLQQALKQKSKYLRSYNVEFEARNALEKELRTVETLKGTIRDQESIIKNMSALLDQYESRVCALERDNVQLKSFSIPVDRYLATPIESQISQEISPQQFHRESADGYLRHSRSASQLARFSDSPFDPVVLMSPINLRESRTSPQFFYQGNTPPTFRQGGLTQSVKLMQGVLKDSLAEIRLRVEAMQDSAANSRGRV